MKRAFMYSSYVLTAFAAIPVTGFATTWTVTTTSSGGQCTADSTNDVNCTLDAAIADAGAGDTIHFSAAVQGGSIPISGNTPLVNGITIDASPGGVTLDGAGTAQIFYFSSGTFTLSHLVLKNGLGSNCGG